MLQRLCFFAWSILLFQQPCFAQGLLRFHFTHYSVDNGMVSNQVRQLAFDARGHLWAATNQGLERFDGIRFTNFPVKDESLGPGASNQVVQLVADGQQRLWLQMQQGSIGLVNTESGRVNWVTHGGERGLLRLHPANKQLLLLREGARPLLYQPGDHVFKPETHWPTALNGLPLQGAALSPWPHQYFVFNAKGIGLFDALNNRLIMAGQPLAQMLGWASWTRLPPVVYISCGRQGMAWLVAEQGKQQKLYGWDIAQGKWVVQGQHFEGDEQIENYRIDGLAEMHNNEWWSFGRYHLARYQAGQQTLASVELNGQSLHPLQARTLTHVATDREGSVWVATGNNGLFRCAPASDHFTSIKHVNWNTGKEGLFGGHVLVALPKGGLLAGHLNDGLAQFDSLGQQLPAHRGLAKRLGNYSVWAAVPSRRKDWWWLALDDRLVYYHLPSEKAIDHLSPWPPTEPPTALWEDPQGGLWIGRRKGGLFHWAAAARDCMSAKPLNPKPVLNNGSILQLLAVAPDHLWVAGQAGLWRVNWKNAKPAQLIGPNWPGQPEWKGQVRCMLPLAQQQWLLATDKRLFVFDAAGRRLRQLLNSAFLNTEISSLLQGPDGFVWAGSTQGVSRLQVDGGPTLTFNRQDGQENDFFMHGAATQWADGRMAFTAPGSITTFNPQQVSVDLPTTPEVRIHQVLVAHRRLNADSLLAVGRLDLAVGQQGLDVDVGVNSLRFQTPVFYRLLGLDSNWRSVGRDYRLSFAYLPPGHYQLQLYTLGTGQEHGPVLSLPIGVAPPFWFTWWFAGVLALTLAAALFFIDRQRQRRLAQEQLLRQSLGRNLQDQVSLGLGNIQVLSQLAALKLQHDAGNALQLLTQVQAQSHGTNRALNDLLWLMEPANDGKEALLQRMSAAARQANAEGGPAVVSNWQAPWPRQLSLHTKYQLFLSFQAVLAEVKLLKAQQVQLAFPKCRQGLCCRWHLPMAMWIDQAALSNRLAAYQASLTVEEKGQSLVYEIIVGRQYKPFWEKTPTAANKRMANDSHTIYPAKTTVHAPDAHGQPVDGKALSHSHID